MLRSNNPVFRKAMRTENFETDYAVATYKGVTVKTVIYLVCTLIGAVGGVLLAGINETLFVTMLSVSGIFTFIFALTAMISPKLSKVCGIMYCLAEGMLVGVISTIYESVAGGVILATLISTFTVLLVISTLFMSGIIKVNSKFMKFLLTIVISVILSQLILFVFSLVSGVQFGFGLNFGVSLVMIFVASLYLLMDMQQVVNIVEGGFPKQYEWYVAFGLVFTLIWIYLELLPLVFRLIGRDS